MKFTPFLVHSALVSMGFLLPVNATAQTPVSTSTHMSGSCASCDLSGRNLTRSTFRGSNFQHSNFSQSNLSGSKIYQSDLSNTTLNKSFLMRVFGEEVNFAQANLQDATLTEATIIVSDFTSANIKGTDLTRGKFMGSDFSGAYFKSAEAPKADFSSAIFNDTVIKHSNFLNANFRNASLIGADFGESIVTGCNFEGANLSGADLSDVPDLLTDQIIFACGDKKTRLPNGFEIRYCGDVEKARLKGNSKRDERREAMFDRYSKSPSSRQTITLSQDDFEAMIRDMDRMANIAPQGSVERDRWSKHRNTMVEQAKPAPAAPPKAPKR